MLRTCLAVFLACVCIRVWESDRFHAAAERGCVPGHLEDITRSLKLSPLQGGTPVGNRTQAEDGGDSASD